MSSFNVNQNFAELIPPRAEVEDRYLLGSLLAYGCRMPLRTWEGWLLDGHRREDICIQHGLERETTEVPLPTITAAAVWVGLSHVARHDLDEDRRAAACANLIRRFGGADRACVEIASDGRLSRGLTKSGLGDLASVSARRVADALNVAAVDETLFGTVYTGGQPLLAAKRQLRDQRNAVQRNAMANRVRRLTRDVRHGDFRQRLDDLPDDSVDLIFTDPPYHKKHLPLYGDLAEVAGRVLRLGGSLTVTPAFTGCRATCLQWRRRRRTCDSGGSCASGTARASRASTGGGSTFITSQCSGSSKAPTAART